MAATPTTRPANLRRPEPAFQRRGRLARQLIVVPVTALFLVPLWLMLVASLRPLGEAPPQSVQWFPTSPAWGNYAEVFEAVPFARYTANSLLVAAIAVPLSVVVASWAGFAIARLPRRSRVFLIGMCVGVLMIPATSLLVGRVSVFRWLGLTDTPIPLMAPALLGTSPLFVLLYAWTTSRLSGDLFDLALERGLSPVATWWRVAMPLQRGTTAAVASLSFVISGELPRPVDLSLRRALVHGAARHAVARDRAGDRAAADARRVGAGLPAGAGRVPVRAASAVHRSGDGDRHVRIRSLGALLVAGLVLAACTSEDASPQPGGPTTVSVWVSGDPEETQAFVDVAAAFEMSQDAIDVDLVTIAERDDLIARLSTSLAGGEPPDVSS